MAEETQLGKRKRVYSLDPHATLRATFSHNYLNYLLPAMLKLGHSFQSSHAVAQEEEEEEEEERSEGARAKYRLVKHQVDMALALSASGFNWSHALKQKLETDHMNVKFSLDNTNCSFGVSSGLGTKFHHLSFPILSMAPQLQPPINIPRPLLLSGSSQNSALISKGSTGSSREKGRKRARKREEEEDDAEVDRRLATLRRILPGGNDMGTSSSSKLFYEVESYVVCLELQVNLLRSLVGTR